MLSCGPGRSCCGTCQGMAGLGATILDLNSLVGEGAQIDPATFAVIGQEPPSIQPSPNIAMPNHTGLWVAAGGAALLGVVLLNMRRR